jgi:hypothetical protein
MTGLTETEHLVAALEAGGVDYVTKPIKPKEVMARMGVHLQGARRARQEARQAGQARNALDAFGYASITVRMGGEADGKLIWQTPLARDLLMRYYGTVRTANARAGAGLAAPPHGGGGTPDRATAPGGGAGAAPPDLQAAPADRRWRGQRRPAGAATG